MTTERLSAMLTGIGVDISRRQVVRLISADLEPFEAEDSAVLGAGLSTARWTTVDDTGARHGGRDAFTTQIGDDRFTVSAPAMHARGWRSSSACAPAPPNTPSTTRRSR